MSIQVKDGWWYKNRAGDLVHIVGCNGPTEWPFQDDIGYTYRKDGTFEIDEGEESRHDLVEEMGQLVPEPRETFVPRETVAVPPVSITVLDHPDYNHGNVTLPQSLTCYVTLRDTPDVESLPDNTYAHILENGALLVRTIGDDKQVALFAPHAWLSYVNKGTKR